MSIPEFPPDHKMRPDCAKEFGKIEATLHEHETFRREVKESLSDIKRSLETIVEIKEMLAVMNTERAAEIARVAALEATGDKLDRRMWGERVKIGGFSVVLVGLIKLIELLGGK